MITRDQLVHLVRAAHSWEVSLQPDGKRMSMVPLRRMGGTLVPRRFMHTDFSIIHPEMPEVLLDIFKHSTEARDSGFIRQPSLTVLLDFWSCAPVRLPQAAIHGLIVPGNDVLFNKLTRLRVSPEDIHPWVTGERFIMYSAPSGVKYPVGIELDSFMLDKAWLDAINPGWRDTLDYCEALALSDEDTALHVLQSLPPKTTSCKLSIADLSGIADFG